MLAAITSLKSPAIVNKDIFWHIPTDRAFKLTNISTPTFDEYARVTADTNVQFDGPNKKIVISDGTFDRVIIGKLS